MGGGYHESDEGNAYQGSCRTTNHGRVQRFAQLFGTEWRKWSNRTSNLESSTGLVNTRTYNTMLKGYATFARNSDNGEIISYSRPRMAEQLLDQMEMSYHSNSGSDDDDKSTSCTSIIPDKFSYTTVTSAWGRSNSRPYDISNP